MISNKILLNNLIKESRLYMPAKMEAFKEPKRFKFAEGGRGGGKSESAIKIILDIANKRPIRVLCTREIQNSIEESIYSLLRDKINELCYNKFNILNNSIIHENGSKFIFRGLWLEEKKQSIKSLANIDYAIVEEAQAVSDGSLKILIPTIRKKNSEIWFLYNRLLEEDPVHKLQNTIEDEEKIIVNINYYDNPFLPDVLFKDAMRSKKRYEELGDDEYLHVWLGYPRQMSDACIIGLSDINQAIKRVIDDNGIIEVGADIARYGDDRIMFVKRKGLKAIEYKEYKKLSIVQTANHLKEFVNFDKTIPIKIDDTGVGGGVTDILKADYYNVIPVNFGSKAKDNNKYFNTISEMWFEFKNNLQFIQLFDNIDMKNEITTRQYNFDNKGRFKVEPKDAYKKRMGKSPDFADALLLCYYNVSAGPEFISLGSLF